MAKFDQAVNLILLHEGGYVDNKSDSGQATNYGISLKFLAGHPEVGDFDNDGDVDAHDIAVMNVDDAKRIYKAFWWDKYKYGTIVDQTIATKVFDLSINMGSTRAHILLQQALNSSFSLNLACDGILGPATINVINCATDGDQEQTLITAYCDQAWQFYQRLIQNNPKLAVFQKGWKNRAYSISVANSLNS